MSVLGQQSGEGSVISLSQNNRMEKRNGNYILGKTRQNLTPNHHIWGSAARGSETQAGSQGDAERRPLAQD